MILVDGRAIAQKLFTSLKTEVSVLGRTPKLTAITCAPNAETQQYLRLKQQKAAEVGIELVVVEVPVGTTTHELIETIAELATETDGIVVQLPLPPHIDTSTVLAEIPANQDPDGFSFGLTQGACVPPVVDAIVAIANTYDISFINKKIVVLGQGRLVGKPMTIYLEQVGATVTSFAEYSGDQRDALKAADIIISGIGKPGYLTLEMVQDGVVIFDAGASEDGGVVRGDADPKVAQKASLFTPVPGGIGPITIAVLLKNLVTLVSQK